MGGGRVPGHWVPGFMPVVVAPEVDAIAAPDAGSEVFAPIVVPTGSEVADAPAGGVMEIGLRTDSSSSLYVGGRKSEVIAVGLIKEQGHPVSEVPFSLVDQSA